MNDFDQYPDRGDVPIDLSWGETDDTYDGAGTGHDAISADSDDDHDIDESEALDRITAADTGAHDKPADSAVAAGRYVVAADSQDHSRRVTERIPDAAADDGDVAQLEAQRAPYRTSVDEKLSQRDLSGLTTDEADQLRDRIADQMGTVDTVLDELGAVRADASALTERDPVAVGYDEYLSRARQICSMRPLQPDETPEAREGYIRYVAEEMRLDDMIAAAGPEILPEYRPGDEIADSNEDTRDLTDDLASVREAMGEGPQAGPASPEAPVDKNHPYYQEALEAIMAGGDTDPVEVDRLATIQANIRLRAEARTAEPEATSEHQAGPDDLLPEGDPYLQAGRQRVQDEAAAGTRTDNPEQLERAAHRIGRILQRQGLLETESRVPLTDTTEFDAPATEQVTAWRGAADEFRSMVSGTDVPQRLGQEVHQVGATADEDDIARLLARMREGTWAEPGTGNLPPIEERGGERNPEE